VEERDYLLKLPYTITLPHFNAIVVHAGLVSFYEAWLQ
jgi:hypothetical protein